MNNVDNLSYQSKKQRCFVVMPTEAPSNYENGHFQRVYQYLVQPACEAAGFLPLTIKDLSHTQLITLDTLKYIVESDLVLCDISGHDPVSYYALGIRQGFGLPVVATCDGASYRKLDIPTIKYVTYESSLRVDLVTTQISQLAEAITQTTVQGSPDLSTIANLLTFTPTSRNDLDKTTLPAQTEPNHAVLEAIADLSERITHIEQQKQDVPVNFSGSQNANPALGKVRTSTVFEVQSPYENRLDGSHNDQFEQALDDLSEEYRQQIRRRLSQTQEQQSSDETYEELMDWVRDQRTKGIKINLHHLQTIADDEFRDFILHRSGN